MHMKIEQIATWQAFQAVAIHGGFSRAAEALRVGVPQLSKRIAKLEEQLGVRLFQRSTRVVNLTDEGRALLPRVSALLEDWAGVESAFEAQTQLAGTIRVASTFFIAQRLLIPVFEKFQKAHPRVHIELDLSENLLNMTEAGIDLAIRIHDTPEANDLIYKKLAVNQLVLCASPRYLESAQARLTRPADLVHHPLLMLDVHRGVPIGKAALTLGDLEKSKTITCSDGGFLTELALRGSGILVRSIWDVREHLKKGRLVQVLKNYPLEPFGSIYAVIPSRRYLAPRVRALLDLIERESAQWQNAAP